MIFLIYTKGAMNMLYSSFIKRLLDILLSFLSIVHISIFFINNRDSNKGGFQRASFLFSEESWTQKISF